ncbi:hypothetical protein J6590_055494 [Homalodisca vitripennis]|nr:hypothetical protein J6590_055494 [Homalodisca vitripennis]
MTWCDIVRALLCPFHHLYTVVPFRKSTMDRSMMIMRRQIEKDDLWNEMLRHKCRGSLCTCCSITCRMTLPELSDRLPPDRFLCFVPFPRKKGGEDSQFPEREPKLIAHSLEYNKRHTPRPHRHLCFPPDLTTQIRF